MQSKEGNERPKRSGNERQRRSKKSCYDRHLRKVRYEDV